MNVADQIALTRTTYDRAAMQVGVVHLGYGAFHRAHQAVYLDDYMQVSDDLGWGIAAVNLRAAESTAFAASRAVRDGYLLKTTAPDGTSAMRLVRSHMTFDDWTVERARAEALLSQPGVHMVTLTVTESGYALSGDRELNAADPVIAAEIAGGVPRSVYGFLAAALAGRAATLDQPITILSSDNIRSNGRALERCFLVYLDLTGQRDLAAWVREKASFPCSMVDRITPRTSQTLKDEVQALLPDGPLDPIQAEAFSQWVVEDRFAGPMPDLAMVGVQVVADVDPFEEAKIRILNGGHTGLAYLGALAGYQTFDQAMADPTLRAHFDAWEREEVLPGLTLDLPFDRSAYLDQIAARFSNAVIADQLDRICMDGYAKVPLYVTPTLAACLAQGITPRHGYRTVASWYVFAKRAAKGASGVRYHEPNAAQLAPLLEDGQRHAFAHAPALWGDLPTQYPEFAAGLLAALDEMDSQWPA